MILLQVYDSLEKAMRSSQAYQLKKLSSYYDRIVAVNKKQMEANVKEANKKVAKIHTSKDEAARYVHNCFDSYFVG